MWRGSSFSEHLHLLFRGPLANCQVAFRPEPALRWTSRGLSVAGLISVLYSVETLSLVVGHRHFLSVFHVCCHRAGPSRGNLHGLWPRIQCYIHRGSNTFGVRWRHQPIFFDVPVFFTTAYFYSIQLLCLVTFLRKLCIRSQGSAKFDGLELSWSRRIEERGCWLELYRLRHLLTLISFLLLIAPQALLLFLIADGILDQGVQSCHTEYIIGPVTLVNLLRIFHFPQHPQRVRLQLTEADLFLHAPLRRQAFFFSRNTPLC